MSEHLRVILALPKGDANYSQRWNLIKGYFPRIIEASEKIPTSCKRKGERGIWQRRFWKRLIRDNNDYEKHANYIHYNPVKHGYVDKPIDWLYSSIHHYIARGILPGDWLAASANLENKSGK